MFLGLVFGLLVWLPASLHAQAGTEAQRSEFAAAWQAAGNGQRQVLEAALQNLQGYSLYPYLQYEEYRFRRASTAPPEINDFIDQHRDWAFTDGLERAWLRALGERKRWDSLIAYAPDAADLAANDTEVQCYLARAQIQRGGGDELVSRARQLWAVGKSQPDACDPLFDWLRKQAQGVTSGLAWERIRRAMEAREPRLTLYLARYVEQDQRLWVERWQQQDRGGYQRIEQARTWSDVDKARDIVDFGLRRLARSSPDRAWRAWQRLNGHFSWPADTRNGILREIALWSAVEGLEGTAERMRAVPEVGRDDQLLEWWARHNLRSAQWAELILTIAAMPDALKSQSRWRYWDARARLQMGDPQYANELLSGLSKEASFYGFLAADQLQQPYSICPKTPQVDAAAVDALARSGGFARSLELYRAGIQNWSRAEWHAATRGLDQQGLRQAAAIARREDWPDRVVFALGNSGDLQWYDWRFPTTYQAVSEPWAQHNGLDLTWVLGLMRSESAMAPDAISSAGARGLMQVTPGTARGLAKRHGITYHNSSQLLLPAINVELGTTFLGELMERYGQNPVLASGAYNAGPHVVDRWMKERVTSDPAVWIETLPYYETRDYIPRVLAFSTLYDWRLNGDASRISNRMPMLADESVPAVDTGRTEVVCSSG